MELGCHAKRREGGRVFGRKATQARTRLGLLSALATDPQDAQAWLLGHPDFMMK